MQNTYIVDMNPEEEHRHSKFDLSQQHNCHRETRSSAGHWILELIELWQ